MEMKMYDIENILTELEGLQTVDRDPELKALVYAILLEDVFGITLSDTEMDNALLGDPASMKHLIAGKLKVS